MADAKIMDFILEMRAMNDGFAVAATGHSKLRLPDIAIPAKVV